jgi:hypothetical protein
MTMAVTDQQLAILRAMLSGNAAEHKRLLGELDRNDRVGYSALVTAAFIEAVDRRFGKDSTPAEAIEYVADVRSRLDDAADAVDPRVGERLILKVVTGASTDDIDPKASSTAKLFLLTALVADQNLDSVGLDEFMASARKLADHLLG